MQLRTAHHASSLGDETHTVLGAADTRNNASIRTARVHLVPFMCPVLLDPDYRDTSTALEKHTL